MEKKKYVSYQSTDFGWLGDVPKHWEIRKLKYIFRIEKRIAGELGYDVLSITQRGIKVKDVTSGGGQLSMDYSKYQRIFQGEFGMNHMDLITGYVDLSKYDGVISPDYRVFRLIDANCEKQYLLRILQLCYHRKIFFAEGQGAAQLGRWRMPSGNFKNFCFPVPPLEEQLKIAAFLDYKLAKIERFIRKKKQLIKLLNEQKAAIINQAVTKGLDPKVPMKDSGIEWLGEVPAHWKVRKLKYLADIYNGATPKSDFPTYWNGDVIWLTPEDISKNIGKGVSNSKRKITELGLNSCGTTLVPKKSIILTTRAPIGNICITEIPVCTNQGCKSISIKQQNIKPEYILFFLLSQVNALQSLGKGTTFMELSTSSLKNFPIVYSPTVEERTKILDYIIKETSVIDTTITTIEKEIILVQEYKTALIAEAVTGKIDVRDYVIPELVEEDAEETEEEEEVDVDVEMINEEE